MSLANSWRMSGDIYDAFTRPDALCSCGDAKDPHCIAPGQFARSSMHSSSVLTMRRHSLLCFEHNEPSLRILRSCTARRLERS
jgi:hypothetical protein